MPVNDVSEPAVRALIAAINGKVSRFETGLAG